MSKKSFKIRANLAQALDDTVKSAKNNAGELHVEIIPLRKISLDPENPRDLVLNFEDVYKGISKEDSQYERKKIETETLKSIAQSIEKQGVINPVVVYKHEDSYRLIAGERRTLASILAKREDIPAKILTSKPDALKLSLIQWIENIEREDLSLWERIRNIEKVMHAYGKMKNKTPEEITPADLISLIGCSVQHGYNYHYAINASDQLRESIKNSEIKNLDKAALIARAPQKVQPELIAACVEGRTLSELKKQLRDLTETKTQKKIGRPMAKVNFGSTSNPKVAKTILNTILEHENFKIHKSKIEHVDWGDHKSIAKAFRKLIQILEQV